MMAGFIFGIFVSSIPILISIGFFGSQLTNPISLALGMIISALGFAAMGIMFAFLPGQGPGQVMMPLNFVRIPLLFVSGVFIPVKDLPPIGQIVSMFSPLTHSIELVRYGLGGENFFSPILNIVILFLYLVIFMFLGIRFHVMSQRKE
jgi:ABC-2 type transport system permease protein